MKLNKKLVDQLAKGEIAIINDGSLEQLKEVLSMCFPDNEIVKMIHGSSEYYFKDINLTSSNGTNLPKVSISKFYEMEKEIIGYKLIKPEYLNAVCSIVGPWFKIDSMIQMGSHIYDLEHSGMLDKCFTTIYEEEDFRVGDVVVFVIEKAKPLLQTSIWSKDIILEITRFSVNGDPVFEKIVEADSISNSIECFRHATPQEKEKYLLDKANRDYPKGTEYMDATNPATDKEQVKKALRYFDTLELISDSCGGAVYCEGKWAEKIERQLSKIGGLEGVETKCHIKYGHKNLSKKCLRQMEAFGITSIHVQIEGGLEYFLSDDSVSELYKAAKK